METLVGNAHLAKRLLEPIDRRHKSMVSPLIELIDGLLLIRGGSFAEAAKHLNTIPADHPSVFSGYQSRLLATRALAAALIDESDTCELALAAIEHSEVQGATPWKALAEIVLGSSTGRLSQAISSTPRECGFIISCAAELIALNLELLDDAALEIVRLQAISGPERWRPPLRERIGV